MAKLLGFHRLRPRYFSTYFDAIAINAPMSANGQRILACVLIMQRYTRSRVCTRSPYSRLGLVGSAPRQQTSAAGTHPTSGSFADILRDVGSGLADHRRGWMRRRLGFGVGKLRLAWGSVSRASGR